MQQIVQVERHLEQLERQAEMEHLVRQVEAEQHGLQREQLGRQAKVEQLEADAKELASTLSALVHCTLKRSR